MKIVRAGISLKIVVNAMKCSSEMLAWKIRLRPSTREEKIT